MRLEDLRGRAVISVEEAGQLLGVSRPTAYASVRDGSLPSIRISPRRVVVPVGAFLALLGFESQSEASPAAKTEEAVTNLEAVDGQRSA